MTKPFFEGYASSPSSSTKSKPVVSKEQLALLVAPAVEAMLTQLQQQLSDSGCRLWTTSQTAHYLGISKSTLEKKRSMQPELAPPCKMIFGSCKYDPLEVEAWLHANSVIGGTV